MELTAVWEIICFLNVSISASGPTSTVFVFGETVTKMYTTFWFMGFSLSFFKLQFPPFLLHQQEWSIISLPSVLRPWLTYLGLVPYRGNYMWPGSGKVLGMEDHVLHIFGTRLSQNAVWLLVWEEDSQVALKEYETAWIQKAINWLKILFMLLIQDIDVECQGADWVPPYNVGPTRDNGTFFLIAAAAEPDLHCNKGKEIAAFFPFSLFSGPFRPTGAAGHIYLIA